MEKTLSGLDAAGVLQSPGTAGGDSDLYVSNVFIKVGALTGADCAGPKPLPVIHVETVEGTPDCSSSTVPLTITTMTTPFGIEGDSWVAGETTSTVEHSTRPFTDQEKETCPIATPPPNPEPSAPPSSSATPPVSPPSAPPLTSPVTSSVTPVPSTSPGVSVSPTVADTAQPAPASPTAPDADIPIANPAPKTELSMPSVGTKDTIPAASSVGEANKELAFTGFNAAEIGLIALSLLGIGGAATVIGRRK